MEQLSVDRKCFSGPFPNYSQPEEVGIFSLTSGGFFSDGRNLKYYKEPKQNVHFDLNKGYPEKFVDWKDEGGDLDHILKWIKVKPSALSGVDFVTLRGHLTKVACTPYDPPSRSWKMAVTKFKGTWYISQVHEPWEDNPQMNYWGHKFEQYLTADTADGEPNTDAAVDLNEAFYTVVTSNLNNSHSLLFSAEVDGRVTDKTVTPPTCYVEMKTNKRLQNPNDHRNLSRKLQRCWVQSFLVGVPEIVFGFRDNKGVVSNVECFRTRDIPGKVSESGSVWEKAVCMNFCDAFLSYVKRCATKDDASVVYLFQRQGAVVTWEEHIGSPLKFLPDWYTGAV